MPTDLDLIEQFRHGQKEAFAQLYDRYIEKIYKFVYYKTYHKETAEDLVSTIFLKAVKNINGFDVKGGSFQAWLYMIARNAVIDHYRSDRPNLNIDDIWDLPSNGDAVTDIDNQMRMEKVKKYLSTLKSEQRDILIMKMWQGMSYQEIAEITGKTEASCKMMLSRTLRDLRKAMPLEVFIFMLLFGSMGV